MRESTKPSGKDREGRETLTDVLRAGAKTLIAQALGAAVAEL